VPTTTARASIDSPPAVSTVHVPARSSKLARFTAVSKRMCG
jgi:hypothetical protein